MGIQDKNSKNSIKSKNYLKIETLRKLEKLTLIDWHIVIMNQVKSQVNPTVGGRAHQKHDAVKSVPYKNSALSFQ